MENNTPQFADHEQKAANISLVMVKHSHQIVRELMPRHYSKPLGFVGRSICYLVFCNSVCYGATVAGSATRFLPNRNEFLNVNLQSLNHVVNNTFFHVEKVNGIYPCRNFVQRIIATWRAYVSADWMNKYGDTVSGFETLVELPRTGECYRRDGWQQIGQTVGYTCKRTAEKGTDSWSGKRIWNTHDLKPKLVFARSASELKPARVMQICGGAAIPNNFRDL